MSAYVKRCNKDNNKLNNDYTALIVQQMKQSGQLEAFLKHPSVQEVLAQSQPKVSVNESSKTVVSLSEDEEFFLQAFRGFILTEAGNPMVGMATKFARYLQSEVDKSKVK